MENALLILVTYLGVPDHRDEHTLSKSPKITLIDTKASSIENVKKLKILFLLVKCCLQNAAVNSQLMKHESALQNAYLGKYYFKVLIFNLQSMNDSFIKLTKEMERRAALKSKQEDESAYFAPELGFPELKRFQRLVSSSVLNDFDKFCFEVLNSDPTEVVQRSQNQQQELSNVIFWKYNLENNEKYFKKELASRSRDLGVSTKFATLGLRDFNIGNVMHIKPLSATRLNEEVDFTDYFGVKLAVEVLLTYSCCLFSIATENRFICQKEFEVEAKINEFKGGPNESKRSLKIYKLQKNPNFISSYAEVIQREVPLHCDRAALRLRRGVSTAEPPDVELPEELLPFTRSHCTLLVTRKKKTAERTV